MEDFPPIKCKRHTIHYFDTLKNGNRFAYNSIALFGDSGAGKSFYTNTIAHSLNPYINITYSFSPTANVDQSYSVGDYTSKLLVYKDFNVPILQNIMNRGESLNSIKVNILVPEKMFCTLKELVLPLYKQQNEMKLYKITKNNLIRKQKQYKRFLKSKPTKPEKNKYETKLIRELRCLLFICKKFMHENKLTIDTENQDIKLLSIPLFYCDIKLNQLIIFNDLGPEIESLKGDAAKLASELVTRERHYSITSIYLMQGVTQIKKKDRQQIKIMIFITPGSINNYINSMGIKGLTKEKLEDASNNILIPDLSLGSKRKYPVIVYFKLSDEVYYSYANTKLDTKKIGNKKFYKELERFEKSDQQLNPLLNY